MREQNTEGDSGVQAVSKDDDKRGKDDTGNGKDARKRIVKFALIGGAMGIMVGLLLMTAGYAETIDCELPAYACTFNNTSNVMSCPAVNVDCNFNVTNITSMEARILNNTASAIATINSNFTNCTRTEAERIVCTEKQTQLATTVNEKSQLQTSLNLCIVDVDKYKNESTGCDMRVNNEISGMSLQVTDAQQERWYYALGGIIAGLALYYAYLKYNKRSPADEHVKSRAPVRRQGSGY